MRRAIVVIGALALALVPAGTAMARGDGWQPVVANPYDAACGTTTVHVSFPTNREYFRSFPQSDGSVIEQFTGFLTAHYATDAGASYTANISGPGELTVYTDGSFLVNTEGLTGWVLTEVESIELGTPEIFISSGLLQFFSAADGTVTPIRIPNQITDVCAQLGV